jgi:hypothetical protein
VPPISTAMRMGRVVVSVLKVWIRREWVSS